MHNGDDTTADAYCIQCNRKYCANHLKSHDDILPDHDKIDMADYKVKVKRLEVKECTSHKGQPYTLGCKVCLTLVCVKCFTDLNSCMDEKTHNLLPLDELVTALTGNGVKTKMVDKEEELEKLFKLASKVSSEYDGKTSELVKMLNEQKQKQLKSINSKYEELEKELLEKRRKKRLELVEFMECKVLRKWNELRNHRLTIESRVEHGHLVDIVRGYQELEGQVKGLIEAELPQLNLVDAVELAVIGDSRRIELEIVPSDGLSINSKQGFVTIPIHPTSISSLQTLPLSAQPLSICQYKGKVYVGLDNGTITRIDGNFQLHKSFIKCNDAVESVRLYKDRIYALLYHEADDLVKVYDMSGKQVAGWRHSAHGRYNDVLSLVSEQLIIADRSGNRITIYSLTGEVLRHIPWPSFGDQRVVFHEVDDTSVVISDRGKREVYRLNIASGEVIWTYSTDSGPLALTCHSKKYVIVACSRSSTLLVLDVSTGRKVTGFTDDNIEGDVLGLTHVDRLLVAAKYNSKCVLLYKQIC